MREEFIISSDSGLVLNILRFPIIILTDIQVSGCERGHSISA